VKPLNEHYKKAKEFLANPKIGSDAIIDSLTNGDAGEIFNAILEKHKGKVLFIDCWATWCSPCRGEMPYSKKLIEKFAGQNIEFIFLCIDSEYDKWKASLDEFQIGGTHYFLNPSESSALKKILNISGIPHYIVINKEGIIAKEGFEIRPSNPNVEEEIKKLLQ
jgi:thiol-disulfide isomerase/thioredoxin